MQNNCHKGDYSFYEQKLRYFPRNQSFSNTPYFQLRKNMQQCATASEDGTCIIWDLERFTRSQMVMANSLFQVLLKLFLYFQRKFSV